MLEEEKTIILPHVLRRFCTSTGKIPLFYVYIFVYILWRAIPFFSWIELIIRIKTIIDETIEN